MATHLGSEGAVLAALRQRFPSPAWAMFAGVSNGTGGRATRYADAIAMSVWPSRGLEIHGFEIKVHRRDLLRELQDPKKAEAVAKYCDRWWIAAGSKKVAEPSDLPPAWGLLVPHGKTMKVVKDARKTDAAPLNRTFVAALLRRASEAYDEQRIRDRVHRELREEIYRQCRDEVNASISDDMEIMRQRWAADREELAKAQGALLEATDNCYTPGLIRQAIDLLSKLRGWGGLPNKVSNARNILAKQRDLLGEAEQGFAVVEELYSALQVSSDG